MSQNQPPSPPYPPQPAPANYQQGPPEKKHTVRNVLLAFALLFVLLVGGYMALIGGAPNEIDKSIKESDNRPSGADNALTITEGDAFDVAEFKYAAGWEIDKVFGGYLKIAGLRVTNKRDNEDSALVQIKLWRGSEVLAHTNCTTEPIATGTTVTLSCSSSDKLPAAYDKVTINDSF